MTLVEFFSLKTVVAGAIVLVCFVPIIAAALVFKRWKKKDPGNKLFAKIAVAELSVFVLNLVVLIAIFVVWKFFPESAIGISLQSPLGLLLAFVGLMLFGYVSAFLLAAYRKWASSAEKEAS